jgi:branched-chain amino acid transport system permease protein
MQIEVMRRLVAPVGGSLVLFAVLVFGSLVYASGGGAARDNLVTQMLINAVIVIGMQIYIGNTGVLSFGHIGFGAIAGYAFAILAISVDRKMVTVSDAPFGLSETEWSPLAAAIAAVVVTLAVAVIVGLGLARSGAQSGAVAATVITLALLFMVHEVAVNWDDLTGGDRAGLSFAIGDTLSSRLPIYLSLVGAIIMARLFAVSRVGRLAQAAREDDLAARAMGVDPTGPQMAALLLSVVVVSVGGLLRVYELGSITPKFFFFDFTLLTLTMLIVGGRNSVTGALVGVVAITAGTEFTRYLAGPDVDTFDILFRPGLNEMFLGAAMLGFMIFRPRGLLDDWELDAWFVSRWRRARESAPLWSGLADDDVASTIVARSVTVDFGGFRALEDAHMEATSAEVTGVIGPNGAGKTTLLNALTGLVPTSRGSCELDGELLTGQPSHQIARRGLVRTFQNLRLFPRLTVRENVEIAAMAGRGRSGKGAGVDPLLARVGLWEHRDRRAGELDYGNSRRLELARAAAARPRFLLLDEPTSGMSVSESLAMIDQVRDTAALVGAGVVVIDHDLGFITGICDRIYCLDQGVVISVGTPSEIQADPKVQAAYLGSAAHS